MNNALFGSTSAPIATQGIDWWMPKYKSNIQEAQSWLGTATTGFLGLVAFVALVSFVLKKL